MKAKGLFYNESNMTKLTLRQRLNATPLTKFRIFGFVLSLLIFLLSLILVMTFYELNEDAVFLIFVLWISILIIAMVIDMRNQRQWIRDTAEIKILLDKEAVEKFTGSKKEKIKDIVIGGFAFLFPLILIFLVAVIITSAREMIMIGLVAIPLYFIIRVMRKRVYKESDLIPTFILSEIGMIYITDYLIWGDRWSGSWIDEIKTQATTDGGSVLMIRSVSTNRFGDVFKTVQVELPNHSVSDLQNLIDRIKESNGRNRYRRLREKAHS